MHIYTPLPTHTCSEMYEHIYIQHTYTYMNPHTNEYVYKHIHTQTCVERNKSREVTGFPEFIKITFLVLQCRQVLSLSTQLWEN